MDGGRVVGWLAGVFVIVVVLVLPALQDGGKDGSRERRNEIGVRDIIFVVISQPHAYHARRARIFRDLLEQQAREIGKEMPTVFLLHEKWPEVGSWTLLPILQPLKSAFAHNSSWVFFCEEETRIELPGLLTLLSQHNPSQDVFLGKALRDRQATIIHHFAFIEDPSSFAYPDPAAGFVISTALLIRLERRWQLSEKKPQFSIDVKHEFALFAWDNGSGTALRHTGELCTGGQSQQDNCVTTHPTVLPQCGQPVSKDDIQFAVKTCSKFHKDRVAVVKETWGKQAKHLTFYSNETDPNLADIVKISLPNTERGHCGKTFEILSRAVEAEKQSGRKWLVIADDDTLLSVPRLCRLLSCYDAGDAVAIGERYAYAATAGYGYDYITGGGSMVFSMKTVRQMVESRTASCQCASDDSPDDMIIGMCLKSQNIPITHSSLFHQARPEDYSEGYLERQTPVSFHKHWMVDPRQVYRDWFSQADIDSGAARDEL